MKDALRDIRVLWRSRHGSGFPWPSWRGFGGGWHMAVFGVPPWTPWTLRKKVLHIPRRPWHYARRLRGVALARNREFTPSRYDDVP